MIPPPDGLIVVILPARRGARRCCLLLMDSHIKVFFVVVGCEYVHGDKHCYKRPTSIIVWSCRMKWRLLYMSVLGWDSFVWVVVFVWRR